MSAMDKVTKAKNSRHTTKGGGEAEGGRGRRRRGERMGLGKQPSLFFPFSENCPICPALPSVFSQAVQSTQDCGFIAGFFTSVLANFPPCSASQF